MNTPPIELSAAERLRRAIDARTQAEIDEAVAIADYAAESEWPADAEIDVVGQRPARIGADGTPLLDEFVALEVAALKGVSVGAATWLIRDIVNLRFRHPRLWGRMRCGAIPVFRACQLAAEIARFDLSAEQLALLDDQLVDNLARLSWRRLMAACRGLIADLVPDQIEQRSRQARAERYVRKLPTDDPSVAYLSGRVDTADAIFFDAMLDRIADLLEVHGDLDSKDARRAKSVGILATPARATLLLAEAAGQLEGVETDPAPDVEGAAKDGCFPMGTRTTDGQFDAAGNRRPHPTGPREPGARVVPIDEGPIRSISDPLVVVEVLDLDKLDQRTDRDLGGPDERTDRDVGGPDERSAGDLDKLDQRSAGDLDKLDQRAGRDLDKLDQRSVAGLDPVDQVWLAARAALPTIRWTSPKLLPTSQLYLHIAEDTVMSGRGTVRVEGIGPITTHMLGLLVRHTRIKVTPVLRPYENIAVDSYEIPRRIRDQVILRDQVEVFPFSSRTARNRQLDHTRAYRKGGVGQTAASNLGPLSTKVHRAKTHGHWNLAQPAPGVFWWKSPAGNRYRITPTGVTRIRTDTPLERAFGDALWKYDRRRTRRGSADQ